MFTRSLLRDSVAGLLAAACLLGAMGIGHAQVAFWHRFHLDAQGTRAMRPSAGSLEVANIRAERNDHVQAQIDRMEARARADDRLSGRPQPTQAREDAPRAQNPVAQPEVNGADPRPSNTGPGWQARGHAGGGR